jgi:hypothetical protein
MQQSRQSVVPKFGPLLPDIDLQAGKPELNDGLLGQVNRREKQKLFRKIHKSSYNGLIHNLL